MASPARPELRICFGPFEVDAANGELRKGGVVVKIHPQPFQVLQLLAGRPRQLVTRDEIRRALWGSNTFVDFERGINAAVNQIRAVLGDDPEKPRYIETVPRRGYRFVAPVSKELRAEPAAIFAPPPVTALPQPSSGELDFGLPHVVGRRAARTRFSTSKPKLMVVIAGFTTMLPVAAFWFAKIRTAPALSHELKQMPLTANSSENTVAGGALSPDGKYLAYADKRGVHVKLIATGETRTLAQVSSEYFAWFPDSTRFLASEIERPGIWGFSVMGGAARKFREDGILGAVSPDGASVSFTTKNGRVGDREIWLVGSDGSNARRFLEVGEDSALQEPSWSPDGQRISYYTQHQAQDRVELTVESRDLAGGTPAVVYSEAAATPERTRLRDFVWLPGGRIIFSLAEPDSDLVNSFSIRCNLWELRVDPSTGLPSGALRRLTNWPRGADVTLLYATSDGKKLSVVRMTASVSVYLADLDGEGRRISTPSRLTTIDGWNNAPAWDVDSQAIFFASNRDGPLQIFRQPYSGDSAQPIATGPGSASVPVVSPDGSFLLLVTPAYAMVGGSSTPVQLMRVPRNGGAPQPVLAAHIYDSPRCAKAPSSLCAIAEPAQDRKEMIFTAFDPVQGRGRELARINVDPMADYGWDLSPDGAHIAVLHRVPRSDGKIFSSEGPIDILSLNGEPPREIHLKGVNNFREYVDWAADGRGLILSHPTRTGAELLYADLQGNTSVLWQQVGALPVRGVPSPDGRHLAILCYGEYNNVWMVETF